MAAACGSDDSGSSSSSGKAGSVDQSGKPSATGDADLGTTPGCKAEVKLTGAVEQSWSKGATMSTENAGGPPAFYQSSDGGSTLAVYAKGNGFDEESALLNTEDGSYGTAAGVTGLDVQADGSSAKVDADLASVADPDMKVHVVATFTC